MILLHVTLAQVETLEQTFAVLTPEGWIIPDWLIYMRKVVTGEV